MKLIVGLGNVGKEYNNTRHNVGFSILDSYLPNIKWSTNKYGDYYKEKDVIFLKPSTFMNLSGNAVRYFIDYFKIDIKDILIIHDDMDLELGTFKIKTNSSSGGHNGINSIINCLGTKDFLRLKIGISKGKYNTVDHVLGQFTAEEKEVVLNNIKIICEIINKFIKDVSVDILMNKFN